MVSSPFLIQCDVHQVSVPFPVLFMLVIDPILLELQSKSCGLSLFLGALSHPDDIHTLSTNLAKCRHQIIYLISIKGPCTEYRKCEVVVSPSVPANRSSIKADNIEIPISHSARCFGVWWPTFLSSKKWIKDNIIKARGGSSLLRYSESPIFQSITECRVLPELLYGAEWWILNSTLLSKLKSFKFGSASSLHLPKSTANNTVHLALQWHSITAHVLCIKLGFLLKVVRNDDTLNS